MLTMVAYGSRGDVEPMIALAAGLTRAGHDVELASPAPYAAAAAAQGVKFKQIEPDMAALADTKLGQDWMESGSKIRYLRMLSEVVEQNFERILSSVTDAVADSTAVTFNRLGWPAWEIAAARGLPAAALSAIPMTPTGAFPAIGLPSLPLGPAVPRWNRATWTLTERAMVARFRGRLNAWRRRELGLGPMPGRSWADQLGSRGDPMLLSCSPTLLPQPADYPPHAHITGYWTLPSVGGWTPPPGLVSFLAAGPPPVVVTTGSLEGRRPAAVVDIVTSALSAVGRRGVLVGGRVIRDSVPASSDVYVADALPFSWLFPQAEAIVHHGGTGTIGYVLRAGKPSVSLPLFGDQPFWASCLSRLGAAPAPIPLKSVTAASLTAALRTVLTDPSYAVRARRAGALVSAERGTDRAIEILERRLAG